MVRLPRFRQRQPTDDRERDELALLWPIGKPQPEEGTDEYERAAAAADRLISHAKADLGLDQAEDEAADEHSAEGSPVWWGAGVATAMARIPSEDVREALRTLGTLDPEQLSRMHEVMREAVSRIRVPDQEQLLKVAAFETALIEAVRSAETSTEDPHT
ncbi:MAG: hypothetical protein M3O70_03590 [Actinomycetota bacterium]|nr:hypothetical protein [Actinomycetota bacterium]